ncbi:MAG TPA: hypothetical protein PLZ58_00480 [Candidatus Saccharibacteria bacterium]|nr:hypothetical protein [Candidatus Saccharibacteria bacterium]HRQ07204.1 hypothetical protein [Candidatus Saccharibacteria bacterium]
MTNFETQTKPDDSFDPYGSLIDGPPKDVWEGVRDPDVVNYAEAEPSLEVAKTHVVHEFGDFALDALVANSSNAPRRDREKLRKPIPRKVFRRGK